MEGSRLWPHMTAVMAAGTSEEVGDILKETLPDLGAVMNKTDKPKMIVSSQAGVHRAIEVPPQKVVSLGR